MGNINIIPKVPKHELSMLDEGRGSSNPKQYCKYDSCKALRVYISNRVHLR